ncbi:hypothetical protein [Roseomonas sp. CECT 9278]|uniref:hypothetical protein n=1 Tax=Roseomonas sp. CECT 9278 TaxID=2845823 RepID=UPI001E487107|nr:hypothetical protein [Roseomonas sp. CECT 9278]
MMDRRRACMIALLGSLAPPAAAQAPEPGLPRVLYGTPAPQVLYGNPSVVEPLPEPRRAPPPAAPAPQSSLTFQSGPAYIPPQAYWGDQPGWDRPRRPPRPAPANPPRYVSPERGRFEQPLPQGRYVGRPPGAALERPFQPRPWGGAPERPVYGRPPGP